MRPIAVLNGAGWRLVFERHDDRIRHRIEVQSADGWSTLVESVEGVPSEWWPPSPPLQSLHVESRASGEVALLVGMAGRSHWSASIEIASDGTEAVFDMACRANDAPQWLGCRYRACDRPIAAQHEVHFRALEPGPLQIARDQPGGIEICAIPAAGRWPQTIRWRYAASVQRKDAPDSPGG